MNSKLWHYDYLDQWNERYYNNVFLLTHLTGDEIAIGKEEDRDYFFVAKKDKTFYLIPSEIIEEGNIPFVSKNEVKTAHKGKAYKVINNIAPVVIREEQTMTYKEMINSWMDYDHDEKERFILWKIIVDAAFCSRVNIRVITYPGWMKDSVVFTLSRLRGNCFSVNKPSLGKLKFLLNDATKILGLNEVQNLEAPQKADLAKFYEDVGDFKTLYINPTRSTGGTTEMCKINHLSTLTFSNFPDIKKIKEEQDKELFDNIFDPKIRSRIFPLLFKGGSETKPACNQRFGHVKENITDEEVKEITCWTRNQIYYERHGKELALKKDFKNKYFVDNTRWDRNFQAICERIKLYSDNQEEFDKWTKLLWICHKEYLNFTNKATVKLEEKKDNLEQPIIEEVIEQTPEQKIMELLTKNKTVPIIELDFKNLEKILEKMKERGDIFEVKPGVIAKL